MKLETIAIIENETGKLYEVDITSSVELLQSRILHSQFPSIENASMADVFAAMTTAAVIVYKLIEWDYKQVDGALEAALEKFSMVELEEGDKPTRLGPLASRKASEGASAN